MPPSPSPSPPPPAPLRKRRKEEPDILPPPSPPSPPPFCVIAPARQQRERFSDLRAQLPEDEAYYVANSIEGEVADEATGMRFPPYYNGADPANCVVRVIATYTCLSGDIECNSNLDAARRLCQTSCSNTEGCNIDMSRTHPLFGRVCGLLGGARPACSDGGASPEGLRQLRATYQINVCMAPPAPPPSPPPPSPPPIVFEYVYY